MGIAVVTTVWGGYGRYLAEWAQSVGAQSQRPDQVVIAEFGDCATEATQAARTLAGHGVDVSVVSEPYTGMADARNTAVAAAGTDWVMHLDADDLLLPGTLARVSPLTDRFDVVSLAARYESGRVRSFPTVSARSILSGRLGCFSCSPYRRRLWEVAPYQTLPGKLDYVDSLLWVGFAQQGARFVGLKEPGFVYRQHPDSFKRTLGPAQLAAARRHVRRAIRQPMST